MSTDNKRLHGDGPALTPEKRAADIMLSVLGLNRSELADVYRSQTQDDPTQKLYELATIAASEYEARGESIPAHVQALLTSARQQQLLLEGLSLECSIPKILLVDAEVDTHHWPQDYFRNSSVPRRYGVHSSPRPSPNWQPRHFTLL